MNKVGWNLENTYTELPKTFFTKMELNPVKEPKLVIFNSSLSEELGFNSEELKLQVDVFAGNVVPEGSIPIAKAYAGHQFGHFTILGDGRAMLLGEQITPKNERYDIELKGSGRTPYSRGGDGRASIGPMLREYIISEAMHALGVPTTRSLAVVTTGENVRRETLLPGSILTRVSSSHLRVGTFEYARTLKDENDLKELADYTINRHFQEIKQEENPYLALLREVIKHQALLISKWQLIGFIHGVMNTDNITINGETIDYGPCAFMDVYDPETVFSSIDRQGRYSYVNQPNIAVWGLSRFAETLIPLIDKDTDKAIELCKEELSKFEDIYNEDWLAGMRRKLGLFDEKEEDKNVISSLLTMMYKYKADYTDTFRLLTMDKKADNELQKSEEFDSWYKLWKSRLKEQKESLEQSRDLMRQNNPYVIPRNYKVEEALKEAEYYSDYTVMEKLLDALSSPYDYSGKYDEYAKIPPKDENYRTYCGT